MPSIEFEVGALFSSVGMDAVANDDLPTVEELRVYLQLGRGWVAVDDHDLPIGYLVADVVDNEAHIEQVSVSPTWSRRGIGSALIECAAVWAANRGHTAITLTTFTNVAWNGPYYERLGFRYLPEERIGPELRQIRRQQRLRLAPPPAMPTDNASSPTSAHRREGAFGQWDPGLFAGLN